MRSAAPGAAGLGNCYDVHDIRDERPHTTKNYTQTVWRGDAAKKRKTRKKRAEVNKLRRHVMQKMTQLEHPEDEARDAGTRDAEDDPAGAPGE